MQGGPRWLGMEREWNPVSGWSGRARITDGRRGRRRVQLLSQTPFSWGASDPASGALVGGWSTTEISKRSKVSSHQHIRTAGFLYYLKTGLGLLLVG